MIYLGEEKPKNFPTRKNLPSWEGVFSEGVGKGNKCLSH